MVAMQFLTVIISFLSLMFTCYTYSVITIKDKKLKEIALTPFPVITDIIFKKKSCGEETYMRRFYYGNCDIGALSLNGAVEIDNFDMNSVEHEGFVNECRNNKGKVYFSRFYDRNSIIINTLTTDDLMNKFYYEFCSSELVITNYGALINGICIRDVTVYLDDKRKVKLDGVENNKLECVVVKEGQIVLACDEVASKIDESLCVSDEETYKAFGNKVNVLKQRLPKNALKYKKIVCGITCWGLSGDEYLFDVVVEMKNGFLVSYTIKS